MAEKINIKYFLSITAAAFTSIGIYILFWGGNVNEGESLSILKSRGVVFRKRIFLIWNIILILTIFIQYKLSFLVHAIELLVMIFQMGLYIYLFKKNHYIITFFSVI